ncbi:MAG: hypothetical protein ACRENF_02110, partial [Thermodesulfobacteriota bacterium]
MKRVNTWLAFIIGMLILMPFSSSGQEIEREQLDFQLAKEEAETILSKSDSIPDLQMMVKVKSKAASLLWSQGPVRSRLVFIKLWEAIDKGSDDNSFDVENARIDLLEYLYPKDRRLAVQLIESARQSNSKSTSLVEKISGTNSETRRLAFLSYRLAEEDAVLAARVLEAGLSENTAPMLPLILSRIRDKNPVLANYIASQTTERFDNQSPTIALVGIGTMAGYLFPLTPSPVISLESSESDENLRQQYMFSGYRVLKRSLEETNESLIKGQNFNNRALTLRTFNQALTAGILAEMSSRYAPEYFVELTTISGRLIQTVPKQFAGLIAIQVAAVRAAIGRVEKSEISEAEIIIAIAKEDFFSAQLLIDDIKEEAKKKIWQDILFRSQAQSFVKRGDLLAALSTARKLESVSQSIPILVDIAKIAHKKKDESLSISVLQEAERVSGRLSKGMQARTLFSVATESAYFMKAQSLVMLLTSVE